MVGISDVKYVEIRPFCAESWPCGHRSQVILIDGSTASLGNSFNICAVVSKLADDKINPEGRWKASDVRGHFSQYSSSAPEMGHEIQTAEVVLNRIFSGK